MMSANACSGVDFPELLSALSLSPGAFVFAGSSFARADPAAAGLEAAEVTLAWVDAAPVLKGREEIGTDAAACRLAGGNVTPPIRQSADQTFGSAVSICYEIALRQDFVERRRIANILAAALARRIELIVSAPLILSRL